MQRDLLVLTDQSIRANQKASLTYRLVLPSQVTYDFPLPTMHDFRIWWAERFSGKVYLKACLDGCRMYARHTRAGERQSLAVGSIGHICLYLPGQADLYTGGYHRHKRECQGLANYRTEPAPSQSPGETKNRGLSNRAQPG